MIHAHNGMIACDSCSNRVYDEDGVKYAREIGWNVNVKTGRATCPDHTRRTSGKKGE